MYVDKLNGQHISHETTYQPCSKDRKDTFLTKDGPLFKLKEGTTEYPDSPIILFGLQDLKVIIDLLYHFIVFKNFFLIQVRIKLLIILRTNEQVSFY